MVHKHPVDAVDHRTLVETVLPIAGANCLAGGVRGDRGIVMNQTKPHLPSNAGRISSRRHFLWQSGLAAGATVLTMAASATAADPPTPPAAAHRPTPGGPDPTPDQIARNLRRANGIARRAKEYGHHPFGCILVAPDHETVLMEQGNVDTVNHAESTLVRAAWTNFSPDYLWTCTLYTTFEPCVMCTGTMYWANVGRVVYGAAEKRLLELTGGSEQNPTLDVPCRYVFAHSQKDVKVWGPIPELEAELVEPHRDFWK